MWRVGLIGARGCGLNLRGSMLSLSHFEQKHQIFRVCYLGLGKGWGVSSAPEAISLTCSFFLSHGGKRVLSSRMATHLEGTLNYYFIRLGFLVGSILQMGGNNIHGGGQGVLRKEISS